MAEVRRHSTSEHDVFEDIEESITGHRETAENMATNLPHVLNLSNSIIGVTILAMPFCFKECGIVLGVMLLLFCTWLTLASCQLLMKAGVTSRRKSYGFLAYYTYGAPGKLAVEVGMIGLQIGTLIAQVVIIGDLGPAIVSKFTGLQNTSHLRTALIAILCLCVGLPLGLLKNLHTLSRTSSLCILFYGFFTLYVMSLSVPNLIAGNWLHKVRLWRTAGLFKCLPIFSFAFGCQTQLFILYDSLPDPSLKKINSIVGTAVNLCTVSYLLTGFFGYVAFCDKSIGGDIITEFEVSLVTDILKMGFVLSIAVTFPLIIFPCRGSLYTLLFPQKPKHAEDLEQRPVIPELHFRCLTLAIVIGSMTIGILVPNVEFVLAMNGATMGTLICYIFPAVFFLRVMASEADKKVTAQSVFIFGFLIMILCTYTTLNEQDQTLSELPNINKPEPIEINADVRNKPLEPPRNIQNQPLEPDLIQKNKPPDKVIKEDKESAIDNIVKRSGEKKIEADTGDKDKRIEPPNPVELVEKGNDNENSKVVIKATESKDKVEDKKDIGGQIEKPVVKDTGKEGEQKSDGALQKEKQKETISKEGEVGQNEEKQKELLDKLEKQQEEQKQLIQEQKEILAQLKQHEKEHQQEDKNKQQQDQSQQSNKEQPKQNQQQQQQQQQQLNVGQVQQVKSDIELPKQQEQPEKIRLEHVKSGQQPVLQKQEQQVVQQIVNQQEQSQQKQQENFNENVKLPHIEDKVNFADRGGEVQGQQNVGVNLEHQINVPSNKDKLNSKGQSQTENEETKRKTGTEAKLPKSDKENPNLPLVNNIDKISDGKFVQQESNNLIGENKKAQSIDSDRGQGQINKGQQTKQKSSKYLKTKAEKHEKEIDNSVNKKQEIRRRRRDTNNVENKLSEVTDKNHPKDVEKSHANKIASDRGNEDINRVKNSDKKSLSDAKKTDGTYIDDLFDRFESKVGVFHRSLMSHRTKS